MACSRAGMCRISRTARPLRRPAVAVWRRSTRSVGSASSPEPRTSLGRFGGVATEQPGRERKRTGGRLTRGERSPSQGCPFEDLHCRSSTPSREGHDCVTGDGTWLRAGGATRGATPRSVAWASLHRLCDAGRVSQRNSDRPAPNRTFLPPDARDDQTPAVKAEPFRDGVLRHLVFTCATQPSDASPVDVYHAMAYGVRDRLVQRWLATQRTHTRRDVKRVHYLSAEFLTGRSLGLLVNLGLYRDAEEVARPLRSQPRRRARGRG